MAFELKEFKASWTYKLFKKHFTNEVLWTVRRLNTHKQTVDKKGSVSWHTKDQSQVKIQRVLQPAEYTEKLQTRTKHTEVSD